MVEEQGADATALLGVGDLERDLGDTRLAELHVAPHAEKGFNLAAPHHGGERDMRGAISHQEPQLRLAELALGAEESVANRARAHPRKQRRDVQPILQRHCADLDRRPVAQDRVDRQNLGCRHGGGICTAHAMREPAILLGSLPTHRRSCAMPDRRRRTCAPRHEA
jgi:hypothetical protein